MKIDWEERQWELYASNSLMYEPKEALERTLMTIQHYQSNIKLKSEESPKNNHYTQDTLNDRRSKFKDECRLFTSTYGNSMVNDFFMYWSEPSKSGKMRFEMEKTWDINRRIRVWASRSGVKPMTTPLMTREDKEDRGKFHMNYEKRDSHID